MVNLEKLSEYLKASDKSMVVLTFSEIERILGNELPVEAKQIAKWWWNVKDSKKAKSWLDYGYETFDQKNISARGSVCFRRIEKKPTFQKGFSRVWYFLTDKDAEAHQKAVALLEVSVIPVVTILTLIVTIVTLYITIFPIKSQNQIREDFANLVLEGEYAFDNMNFLEAADYYHKASLTSYDIYSEAWSQQREGACYMVYGLERNDKNYLRRALMIFEKILNTSKYENTESYQEVVIDLCSLYRFLGYDPQDAKWRFIVNKLETTFNFDDLESISAEDMSTFISVVVNLSYYYKTIIYSDSNSLLLSESSQEKAIYYSKAAMQLEKIYDEFRGIKNYDLTYLISICELTSNIIVNAFTNPKDNILEILEEARTLCQDAILTIDIETGNMLQLNIYIKLKRNIGKTYIFSSYASESPDKEDYMLKAYQELIPLFYWDNYEVSENIMYVSHFLLLTKLCTEDDIRLILDRFSSYLQIIRENKDIPAQINAELEELIICDAILLWYDYEDISLTAQKVGHQLWIDLNTVLFDFLSSNQKTELAKYSEKFGT